MQSTNRRWTWLVAWAIATLLLYLVVRGVDRNILLRVAAEADWRWLTVAVASNACILPLGAFQWGAFLPIGREVAKKRLIELFAITSVANNTTPAIIGHATGVVLLAAEPSVGQAASLSVLALDQLAVGLAKLTVLVAASLVLPLPAWIVRGIGALAALVALLLVGVLVAAHQHERAALWSERSQRGPFVRGALSLLSRWARDLEALRSPSRFAVGLGYALCIRLAEAGAIFAVQHAFGLSLHWSAVLIVLAATSLASTVAFIPANLGPYEAAVFGAYRHLGLAPETALVLAVAQHACQLIPAVGIGYVILGRRGATRRSPPAPPAPPEPQRP